ncbi:peptidylprolyl isomerase [Nocardioides cynanchi]|uniref:peptidylprolyl isomerase n=1 Tax=Nocardioides cynanchi TaxID=2558918 RepID=UPI0012472316|nr:peptidylprolyl isomerase [Nocardioides cynanchi]
MLTRLAALAATLVLVPTLAACGASSSSTPAADSGGTPCPWAKGAPAVRKVTVPGPTSTQTGSVPVTIDTNIGTLKATLDATAAPCTVTSFVALAGQGYFDNTPCHRLTTEHIYVLQCGDPTGTGNGGPGYTIPDELHGAEAYAPGTLAMANTGQPNSGGSQFFIVYKDSTANLQKIYTVFGQLDKASLAAVQKVAAKGSDNSFGPGDGAPKQPVTITKVTSGG